MYPLVSVVIPTYNREKTILRAINSVKNQSYNNTEIIIVDDNSTDNTYELIKDQLNDRVRYYKNSVNLGGGQSRNVGVKYAKGELIAFLDSDDEWYNDKLEKQVKKFNDNNVELVYTEYKLVNENSGKEYLFCNKKDIRLRDILSSNCIGTTSSICVKKSLFEKCGGFDSTLRSCQDWDLYIRLFNNNFSKVEEPCLNYYYHNESISGSYEKVIKGNEVVLNKINNIISDNKILTKNDIKYIKSRNIEILAHLNMKFNREKEGKKYFKEALKYDLFNKHCWKHYIASSLLGEGYIKMKRY